MKHSTEVSTWKNTSEIRFEIHKILISHCHKMLEPAISWNEFLCDEIPIDQHRDKTLSGERFKRWTHFLNTLDWDGFRAELYYPKILEGKYLSAECSDNLNGAYLQTYILKWNIMQWRYFSSFFSSYLLMLP